MAWIKSVLNKGAQKCSVSLAFDGKSIGEGKCGMIITLCRHEDGRPVAMIPAAGKKEDSEASEARALLASPEVRLETPFSPPTRSTTRKPPCASSSKRGGDYLIT
jgi:hypothetical protein